MKIEKVKCDICGNEFRKNTPMAYLYVLLHTRPIGIDYDNKHSFDICDSCGRKYKDEISQILEDINQKIFILKHFHKNDADIVGKKDLEHQSIVDQYFNSN